MPLIISEEQFRSRYRLIREKFLELKKIDLEDKYWKKIGRIITQMRGAYRRDKVYAVKYLNHLERYQPSFREEKRALIVKSIELMQKVILHKKLN